MSSSRYRIFLVPEEGGELLPVRRSPRRHSYSRSPGQELQEKLAALGALMVALKRVGRRGSGQSAWAPVYDDPLAFLLDSISDALVVRGPDGHVFFANSLAQELQLTQRRFASYEEFEQGGELFRSRGLQLDLPDAPMTFTLVSRVRR